LGIEGYVDGRWIVLDYGDVVVHLFDEQARDYYALEQLWCDAPQVPRPAASTFS
jgi:ribosome-associated protein